MVTEKQLKEANEKVYGVDHNYLKEGKPFQNINEGQKLNLAGQNFIVLSTSNDE
ncbi:hypothetical protein [Pseudolactococcus paracarnosus]|uniref:Uncharacterized protein n=2 Tax=Pseudolactococcus TaxID=3436058 RepID=A0ABT0AMD2_9LACT|nr:hypothetical protein [Lactococcus paracarnosus]MCJ1977725.1 hypothetical protein [Lactococcus paracarnosus]MCJ1983962.1 hypothetical protein [Lactococcus paracarnosus]MCJ1998519.1 hypothetical protein [Lactococcus paracarnosus]